MLPITFQKAQFELGSWIPIWERSLSTRHWRSHPRLSEQCLQGNAGVPAFALELFSSTLTAGTLRKLSKMVDAAACKTGTRTRLHTSCASFRFFSYFPITRKSIHTQGGYHSHPTASEITKMPTNGGYLRNAPILGSRIRAQIELFEKL